MHQDIKALNEKVKECSIFIDDIFNEVNKVMVGQRYMLERLILGILANGHVLLEGVPGLAKTTIIKSLATVIDTTFKRIQFTPDLLPADLIGTLIYNQQDGKFITKKGPIFGNFILADEINRAPAKVQSALLESMQERQVTIGDETFLLDDPFLVLATQNPIEQEGTYPLPEAQVDRFMLKLKVGYPTIKEEQEIVNRMLQIKPQKLEKIIDVKDIIKARNLVKEVYIDQKIIDYIVNIVYATREPEMFGLKDVKDLISYGASPRASIYLALVAKAYAFMKHRGYVTPEDVRAIGTDVLRHRVIVTYEAEAEEITSEEIIRKVFDTVEVP